MKSPRYHCFTSEDSNWTLNAAMVKKESALEKKYRLGVNETLRSLADIGLTQWEQQDGFESVMIHSDPSWMSWRAPLCISLDGLFIQDGTLLCSLYTAMYTIIRSFSLNCRN